MVKYRKSNTVKYENESLGIP